MAKRKKKTFVCQHCMEVFDDSKEMCWINKEGNIPHYYMSCTTCADSLGLKISSMYNEKKSKTKKTKEKSKK